MNLTEMRNRLRKDLHDEDPQDQRWTDGELDRHIQRAVREFRLSVPLESMATPTPHPTPRDAGSSARPARFEDGVATGGAAYAALEWASFATNRVNVGGQDVWRDYLTWGQQRLGGGHGGAGRPRRRP